MMIWERSMIEQVIGFEEQDVGIFLCVSEGFVQLVGNLYYGVAMINGLSSHPQQRLLASA